MMMENYSSGPMRLIEEPKKPLAMHPKKFALWIFLATVVMLFASLTSAYLVRRANGDWEVFELPSLFYWSSFLVMLSSVTMHLAYRAAKQNILQRTKLMAGITSAIGLLFLVAQGMGLGQLVAKGVHFSFDHPAGSFVYVLAGLHGAHLISGVIFLLIVWNSARQLKITSKNSAQIEMCATYWHFLGGLWLYLFAFLLYFR
jgi:cytochrome c oxidase subunit III